MKKIFFCLLFLIIAFPGLNKAQAAGEEDLLLGIPFYNAAGKPIPSMTNGSGEVVRSPAAARETYKLTLPKKSVVSRFDFSGYVGSNSYAGTDVSLLDKDGKNLANFRYANNENGARYIAANIADKVMMITVSHGGNSTISRISLYGNWVQLPYPAGLKADPGIESANVSFYGTQDAIGYWIYVDGVKKQRISTLTYLLGGLKPDVSASVQVSALYIEDGKEVESEKSPAVSVIPYAANVKPVLKADPKWNEIGLSWTGTDGGTGRFDLYVNDVLTEKNLIDNKYTYKQGVPGKKYVMYVQTTDKYGRSQKSDVLTVVVPDKPDDTEPPSRPKDFVALMSNDMKSINLKWTKGTESDLAGYKLYVDQNGKWKLLNADLIKTNVYVFTNAEPELTYKFRLEALDETGNVSDPTETSITVPTRNSGSETEQTPEYLLVTWNQVEGAVGYIIYLNGRQIATVGPEVREYKITKEKGYNPNLMQTSEAKAKFADGSTGGGGGSSGGYDKPGFSPNDIWTNTMLIVSSMAGFLLLGIVIRFAPRIFRLVKESIQSYRRNTY